jgi:hypothetical protein
MAAEHMQDIRADCDDADMMMRVYLEQITRLLAGDARTSFFIVK